MNGEPMRRKARVNKMREKVLLDMVFKMLSDIVWKELDTGEYQCQVCQKKISVVCCLEHEAEHEKKCQYQYVDNEVGIVRRKNAIAEMNELRNRETEGKGK